MACGVCGKSGHNRRTCIVAKVAEAVANETNKEVKQALKDAGGNAVEHIADQIMEEIEDEAMMQLIEAGCDVALPGLGMAIRLGRWGWKLSKK